MKSRAKRTSMYIIGILLVGLYTALPRAAFAQFTPPPNPDSGNLPDTILGTGGVFQTIANILLLIIGAVAVIMLIIGGFRYVVSAGDSSAIEGAKNTILYAIIGIVVAFLAYAAINFLTRELTEPQQPPQQTMHFDSGNSVAYINNSFVEYF